jgi:SAM-dependent MidA family methyltransferase
MSVSGPYRAAEVIQAEIERHGPISFEQFMDLALYAPGVGYYTSGRDPFGKRGDYYTAEQLQPVFGILVAQFMRAAREELGLGCEFQVIELGAGRAEMAEALHEFNYAGIDIGRGALPQRIRGVVFANEFFDALPVRLVIRRADAFVEQCVAYENGRFILTDGAPASGRTLEYLNRWYAAAPPGSVIEVNLRALDWVDAIAERLERGWLVIVDYGYTAREWVRHSRGTLMSYRRHSASDDVLSDPGERDITAHVPFTIIEERAAERGLSRRRFETLARFLLTAGERDQFAAALGPETGPEALKRRLQLKTLLFEMGETFRVLQLETSGVRLW